MYAFGTGDLEKVMRIPVPVRKWMIRRWNKQKKLESAANGPQDTETPLSVAQKMKLQRDAAKVNNDPANIGRPRPAK